MKIVVSGSLGNISKPLTQLLVHDGHTVTVISSKAEKAGDIEAMGATPAIGSVEDVAFLTATFTGADVVYCMLPPSNRFSSADFDILTHVNTVAGNYAQAVLASGVQRIIHLSSIGAHTNKGNGLLEMHYNFEQILQELPAHVSITHMRPTAFYYNLLAFIPTIKNAGFMASNYGEEDIVPWVSPTDIAAAVAAEIAASFTGRRYIYVASQELSCNQIAQSLGTAIGMPDLKWNLIADEQMEGFMLSTGLNPGIAKGLTVMNAAMHTGELFEDYYRNRPKMGKVKIDDYAQEFAAAFRK